MTTPNSPVDNVTDSINRLIAQLLGKVEANRQEAVVIASSSGKLDFTRAAATILRCAESAGPTPALTIHEAEELARAFIEGDDSPFERLGAGRGIASSVEVGLEADEVLVLCALLAVREQWGRGAHVVEPSAAGANELDAVCPECGSLARLEILLGQYSERYSVCPVCDAYWRIARVGCPHCGERDGRHLTVYSAEESVGRALVHCLSCRRVWRRLELRGRMTPPDDVFIRAVEPWSEELLLDQREDVVPVPLRSRL
ncbi:MAG: formate dehydrogenase accessory protein FdhE [Candidatus Competibacteraceae bacterium]